jgi:hypothetical protein
MAIKSPTVRTAVARRSGQRNYQTGCPCPGSATGLIQVVRLRLVFLFLRKVEVTRYAANGQGNRLQIADLGPVLVAQQTVNAR